MHKEIYNPTRKHESYSITKAATMGPSPPSTIHSVGLCLNLHVYVRAHKLQRMQTLDGNSSLASVRTSVMYQTATLQVHCSIDQWYLPWGARYILYVASYDYCPL